MKRKNNAKAKQLNARLVKRRYLKRIRMYPRIKEIRMQ
jgi:hypothetical protein